MRTFQTAHNCNLRLTAVGCSGGQKYKANKKVTGRVHGSYTIKLDDPDAVLNVEKLLKGDCQKGRGPARGTFLQQSSSLSVFC